MLGYAKRMPNRLAAETSPYLLQHKDNPVEWYPWGEEAFEKAIAEDKPILLSVGYSACHWCHVMAHESFEDAETAALMNQWFVNVKVDREERPDVDGVYMSAVQAITGQGGWPMTVFMTADGKPFYAGTYFPPADGHGRPGFPRVLDSLHRAWTEEREKLLSSAEGITDHLRATSNRYGNAAGEIGPEVAAAAVAAFAQSFDEQWGGFGQAPKFPSPGNLEFLLARHARTGDARALEMVLITLRRMAQGGMYDHLGGGFARYSVDRFWLVPHFEKMLYDNAQLVRVYLHAYQLTGEELFVGVVRETLAYLEREMLDAEGGFFAAQDADSEGIEGKFFVWTPDELRRLFGDDDGALFCEWFGVSAEGNFEDPHHPEFGRRNVLTTWRDAAKVAEQFGITPDALTAKIDVLRPRVLAERERRVHPGLDDKILTSWNGLALAAFAEAARVLGDDAYRAVAERNAAFLREKVWRDGRLLHTYKSGVAKVPGMLEDYTYAALGLIELFKLTGDFAHLGWARELFEVSLAEFRDPASGAFFETGGGAEKLLVREKSFFDAATPSGNGALALLAFWLGRYYSRAAWELVAAKVAEQVAGLLVQAPTGFGTMLQVIELLNAPRRELVIIGERHTRQPLERAARGPYIPWLVLAPGTGSEPLSLFEGRSEPGRALAYICEDMVCQLPTDSPEALTAQLG